MLKHSYSGLITKGLGLPACCGLITMQFSLFRCVVEVIPVSGGGGGAIPINTGHYTQNVKQLPHDTKNRIIKVSLSMKGHTWRQTFYTSEDRANVIVEVVSIVKRSIARMEASVVNVTKTIQAIVSRFRN